MKQIIRFPFTAYNNMHIVLLPLPVQSHLNPFLAIAKLLIPHGFTFTFVVTHELATKLDLDLQDQDSEGEYMPSSQARPITYVAIPVDVPMIWSNGSCLDSRRAFLNSMRSGFEVLLQKLSSSVSCILMDAFLPWGFEVADKFNIPFFALLTTNAHTFALMLHVDVLMSKGLTPVQDPKSMIDCVPGVFPVQAGDLPQSMRNYPSLALDLVNNISKAAGVVINTVYELEEKPLHVIEKQVSVYTVGPMMLMQGSEQSEAEEKLDLWQEERGCLIWLDSRAVGSVLFVAFGSLATFNHDQVKELAEGLEASGQAFLWVIRSNAIDGSLLEALPDGFFQRTKERGLIVCWAPQVEVLSHPAVGGFLTHCGWNSITENLAMGCVPMICWPQVGEQKLNTGLLVNEWKVGLKMQHADGVVKADMVKATVKELMQGEEGRELRRRATKLKERVSSAIQDGGSSQNSLNALVEELRRHGLAQKSITRM